MTRRALLSLCLCVALFGCDGAMVTCGPGTTLGDGVCTADGPSRLSDAGPMDDAGSMGDAGAGERDTGSSDVDAGVPEWGINPPGTPPPEPGCDEASGECEAWEAALLTQMAGARGCSAPLTLDAGAQGVADDHAAHQAALDRMTSSSPGGDLFVQVRDAGSTFMYAGAAFSVTRSGAADVMNRWAMNPDTSGVLGQCWTGAGVAIETSASGASYVSVLLVR